jgi:MFS family permease
MRAVLANRNFRRLWVSQVALALGDSLMQMGLLEVFRSRGLDERVETAKLFFAVSLPGLFLGPVAMAYLDRWQRRSVLVVSDVVRAALVAAILAWLTWQRSLLLVYVGIGALGSIATFYLPSRSALLPNIVERDRLVKANTLFATSLAVAMVGGRTLGGFVAEQLGVTWAVLANVVAYLCSVGLLWRIALAPRAPANVAGNQTRQGGWSQLKLGAAYLQKHPVALPLVILSGVFAFLLGILMVAFVGYAMDTLGLRTGGVGYLIGAGGVGTALGIGAFSKGRPWTQAGWLPFAQLVVAAGALVLLSFTRDVRVAALLVAALGAVAATAMIHIDAKLQAQVEETRRGAVFAARGMLISATMIVAFWLQFGTALFRQTPAPVILRWLGVGALVMAAGLALLARALLDRPGERR